MSNKHKLNVLIIKTLIEYEPQETFNFIKTTAKVS